MKQGIHPLKKRLSIFMSDGSYISTTSVASYHHKLVRLSLDYKSHICWNNALEDKSLNFGNRLQQFKKKYK